MRRTERVAYRTKFYSNLSSPTRFDEEPKRASDFSEALCLILMDEYIVNRLRLMSQYLAQLVMGSPYRLE